VIAPNLIQKAVASNIQTLTTQAIAPQQTNNAPKRSPLTNQQNQPAIA
jgi:hypothetical protein